MPSWIWAQVTFAAFHFQAFNLDPFSMAFAFLFGVFLFLVADAKQKGKKGHVPVLGLGAAIGIHFVYNIFALASTGSTNLAGMLGI